MASPYVINLDSRPDRWENLQAAWRGAFDLKRVAATHASPGWVGCALSHVKIIEAAKERGDPSVLVWEDDCKPRNRHPRAIKELWNEVSYKLSLYPDQWDVVLGATSAAYKGATYNQLLSTQNVKVYDLPHGFTTHWILYNASSYDRMIEWKQTNEPQIDVYLFNKFRVKVVTPFLAEQFAGFSDIETQETDYGHMFERTESSIRRPPYNIGSILSSLPQIQTPKFMTR
jgi:GR25 family glycosyltransferase involved in LPS biosynthesis